MKRRDFLKVASGAAGGGAAVGSASAASSGTPAAAGPPVLQQENNTTAQGNESGDGTTGGAAPSGGSVTVDVVNYAYNPGTEEALEIPPGTTVNWVWETDGHNIVVESQPSGANWSGHEPLEDTGFEYSHTFTTEGEYAYYCQPHRGLGMEATIVVSPDATLPGQGGGGGEAELDPHEMGVPFQAHFVGIATMVMMVVSIVYTFFVLKYGESRHASSPNRQD